jgi:uncharacterized protein RhaS with RHS repeats
MTPDPIGFRAGDSNLYRYVGNDPADATDPSGLREDKPILFKNRETEKKKEHDEYIAKQEIGKKALKDDVVVVKTLKDLTDHVKPGVAFKYVVVDGKLVVIRHGDEKTPHSFGTLKVNGKVGGPVEAAGKARYYQTKGGTVEGVRFDLRTGHYKIREQSNWREARVQALAAFKKITDQKGKDGALPARYKEDVTGDSTWWERHVKWAW